MKTIILTVIALFIYDAARIVLTAVIRFIKAFREQKISNKLDADISSLPFMKRVQIKHLIKKAVSNNEA